MKIIPLAQAKAQLSACVDEAATHGPIIITRNGKAAAVLLGAGDGDDLEGLILAHSPPVPGAAGTFPTEPRGRQGYAAGRVLAAGGSPVWGGYPYPQEARKPSGQGPA